MKKTLALVFVLAGVASAVDVPETINGKTFNEDLLFYLNQDAYIEGSDFSLTFTVKEAQGFGGQTSFVTLLDSGDNQGYWIHSQEGTYIGMTTTKNSDAGPAPASELSGGVNVYTKDMAEEGATLLKGWISKNTSGTVTNPGVSNSTYTISVSGDDTIIEMSFDPRGTKEGNEKITLQNYKLNLNDIRITLESDTGARITQITNASVTYNGVNHNLMVPEPATATLSLLALAGLAARRRRH